MTQSSTVYVPPNQNILQYTADFIVENFHDRINGSSADFSSLCVLLPHSGASQQFNNTIYQLTESRFAALIPPWSGTLSEWTQQFTQNANPDFEFIDEHARQLLFIDALQQHPSLFKEENKWQVTQALLNLFDELSLNQIGIIESAERWQQELGKAYGIDDQQIEFEHLNFESKIVYTLWHAWKKQLYDNQLYDKTSDYISRLELASEHSGDKQYFICVSPSHYSRVEQAFINDLSEKAQCQTIEFGDNDTGDILSAFIDETYIGIQSENDETPESRPSIKDRALRFAESYPDPSSIRNSIQTYLSAGDEEQVQAIDHQVRLSLIEGHRNIAVISEDRKLSRRLRALLERSGIQLQDDSGWSLATTQSATIIERWLECIEEDFSAYPLLDCLKSPFLDITQPALGEHANVDDFRRNIYRFEHDLIFHENINSNIPAFKKKLKERLSRLISWPANAYDELISTLDYISDSASPLTELYVEADKPSIKLSDFIDALLLSLRSLGVMQTYKEDDAGQIILRTLNSLRLSTNQSNPSMNWKDCRAWLSMALESEHFTPPTDDAVVRLMTLEQSSHLNFDTVIIAATEAQHYPGNANNSPFFNQTVRTSLGLDTWQQQFLQRYDLFRRTILSSAKVLFTANNEENGEEKPVSPWLQLLINFYSLAYGEQPDFQPLFDDRLPHPLDLMDQQSDPENDGYPEITQQAAPVLPSRLIPKRISASAYQHLINCPYQFFSAYGLRLKPMEQLSEELRKADYGERIHAILQTFHSGHQQFGKAYGEPSTTENRQQAENYLSEISQKVFLSDMENNALHRSWLHRWQKHIPSYISWQIEHQKDWDIYRSEEVIERPLHNKQASENSEDLTVYGRLDRIDINKTDGQHEIIDYKTGRVASQEDVDIGENVQLSMYAMLDEQAEIVDYLSVDSSRLKVETKSFLSGQDLIDNREQNRERLTEIFEQIVSGEPMNSWGDDTVCGYCNFSGLCRKESWSENNS